jgi:molybdopterin converting factor small subunit
MVNAFDRPAGGITLELTGQLHRAVGRDSVTLRIENPQPRLGEIMSHLVRSFPDVAELVGDEDAFTSPRGGFPPGFLVIKDGVAIQPNLETEFSAGDSLTLMSMISGG